MNDFVFCYYYLPTLCAHMYMNETWLKIPDHYFDSGWYFGKLLATSFLASLVVVSCRRLACYAHK